MSVRFDLHAVCLSGGLLFVVGCGGSNSTRPTPADSAPPATQESKADPTGDEAAHGHSHERDKMLIADAGPYHALLTAHLAAAGNELDIYFETTDARNPQPAAIAVEFFEAQATTGGEESRTLKFVPAPAEERPIGEPEGRFSHFVAEAPWMKPDDDLLVVARLTLDGREIIGRWKNFVPRRFAHHVD